MNSWIKHTVLGATIGAIYAFISFYLLSPSLYFSFQLILYFGLQGVLFVLSYKIICKLFSRYRSFHSKGQNWPYHIIAGGVSGLISGSINIFLTYNAHIAQQKHIAPIEYETIIMRNLLQYSIGCILSGILIACLICYIVNIQREKVEER